MAYGGSDGVLEKGKVCFVRPSRSSVGKRKRRYSIKDLSRIFLYVVEEHGIDRAYCTIADKLELEFRIRAIVEELQDVPCVDSDVINILPDEVKDGIENIFGSDLDLSTPCEDLDLSGKLKRLAAVLAAIIAVWVKFKNLRVVAWLLRRIVLFGVLIALFEQVEKLLEAVIKMSKFVEEVIPLLQAIGCTKDLDGNIEVPISEVLPPIALDNLGE